MMAEPRGVDEEDTTSHASERDAVIFVTLGLLRPFGQSPGRLRSFAKRNDAREHALRAHQDTLAVRSMV